MTDPIGGTRDRLIRDSLWHLVEAILRDLRWLNLTVSEGGTRKHAPVTLMKPRSSSDDVPVTVQPNAIGILLTDINYTDAELGSLLTIDRHPFTVDIYAESDSIGREMRGDLIAALSGRMPGVGQAGRAWPTVDVLDYRDATPTLLFTCLLEDIEGDRANGFEDHRRYWFTVEGVLVDDHQ